MDLKRAFPLPTLPRLGVDEAQLPPIDDKNAILSIASHWLAAFSQHTRAVKGVDDVVGLFVKESYWRDVLALTWSLRTFAGHDLIREFLQEKLETATIRGVKHVHPEYTTLARPGPDLAWIQFLFAFETGDVGHCSGVVRLVPTQSSGGLEWKAHSILTHLDGLKKFPEQIGAHRTGASTEGWQWAETRQKEVERYETENPTVLVLGGAQSGLMVAARLKAIGVDYLVIEKGDRIGGNWRSRYEALVLHDPVCMLNLFPIRLNTSTDGIDRGGPHALLAVCPSLLLLLSQLIHQCHPQISSYMANVYPCFEGIRTCIFAI
jgi:hypothetical protein